MTQANVLDPAKSTTTNFLSQNLIKDKLEEIFVVFGMIFNEEQFFIKFKNNIFQLNTLVQDNSLPTFRVIRVLMDEFEKIMKSQEKEMLMTITAFYYFLYKNFISLFDEHIIGNKAVTHFSNFVNNPFTQQPAPKFQNYVFPLNVFPGNPYVNYNFNKNFSTCKKPSNLASNEVKPTFELNKISENLSPNKENFTEELIQENKSQKHILLGKKQKSNEFNINEILEKDEIVNHIKGSSTEKPLNNKMAKINFNINQNEKKELIQYSLNKKEDKDNEKSLVEKDEIPTLSNTNINNQIDKFQLNENCKEEERNDKINKEKYDVAFTMEVKTNEELNKVCDKKEAILINNVPKEFFLLDRVIDEKDTKLLHSNENNFNIHEKKHEENDLVVNNMILDNNQVSLSELNNYSIHNEQEEFDKTFELLINNKSDYCEESSINLKSNYILKLYPNFDEENIRIFKTGEITNKEEMEKMKKIVRSDFIKEYNKCFKNKKDTQKVYYFLTKIHNSKGDEYLLKYDKEAYEFTVFEYIFNK